MKKGLHIYIFIFAFASCLNAKYDADFDPYNPASKINTIILLNVLTSSYGAPPQLFNLDAGLPAGWTGNWALSASSTNCFSGACLQSSNVKHATRSSFSVTTNVNTGFVSFYRFVSSEPLFDRCRFLIDGQLPALDLLSGSGVDMTSPVRLSFLVFEGSHTFTWDYTKDNTVSMGADSCWIDQISLP